MYHHISIHLTATGTVSSGLMLHGHEVLDFANCLILRYPLQEDAPVSKIDEIHALLLDVKIVQV